MSFKTAMKDYFDVDGLVGTSPNPTKWSGGNQILDSSQYILYQYLLGKVDALESDRYNRAIYECEISPGVLNKNPNRPDEITHDDIVGAAIAGVITGNGFERRLCDSAASTKYYPLWVVTNTGKLYWESIVKPAHKAFYKHLARPWVNPPSFLGYMFIFTYIMLDALCNKTHYSDKKLAWVIIQGLQMVLITSRLSNFLISFAIKLWKKSLNKNGGLHNVMLNYYGPNHPFTIYAPLLG